MNRGELWWANLPQPAGSEPGYRRPVLIVSSDDFNDSRISTVIVVAITSNLRLAAAPGNVELTSSGTGLSKDSVANVSQMATLDKGMLTKRIGRLTGRQLARIDEGLRAVLDL